MFYEAQPAEQQANYKKMLSLIGNLTLLFSESNCPYLPYRCHENIFCKYFEADNLARSDCSADAKKGNIGIGLKTWVGQNDQKIAEFGKLRDTYSTLSGIPLVKKIAEYRNERIRITKKLHGIDDMIYHIVKRVPGAMQIIEYAFDNIDIDNIRLITGRGNTNNTYFTDGVHTYHFSTSKNTLYMLFEDADILDSFEVEIMADPYSFLMGLSKDISDIEIPNTKFLSAHHTPASVSANNKLCLRLYSENQTRGKFVPEKSGLNQWNAGGRRRDPNELYIPYPAEDRNRIDGFFPPKDISFNLRLPNGEIISAKVCQEADKSNPSIGKTIMSNPNKVLGKWLLRDVFELAEGTLVTYEMLQIFGIDSVVFTKINENEYSVNFSAIGTYETFYNDEI